MPATQRKVAPPAVTHPTLPAWAQALAERGIGRRLPSLGFSHRGVAWPGLQRALPHAERMICVGGATFGGSGKTPVAIALAQELAARGVSVALVGHGHKGRVVQATRVALDMSAGQVGDEAWLAARALAPLDVPVFVAPRRADAVRAAAQARSLLVVDGVLQTAPVRAGLSVLLLPSEAELAMARVFPFGDLRAPPRRLRALCDLALTVRDQDLDVRACDPEGHERPLGELRGRRVGLFTALARPARVLRQLQGQGLCPVAHVRFADHGPVSPDVLRRVGRAQGVDVWVCTDKCAVHLCGDSPRPWVLRATARIPGDLVHLACALAQRLA